MRVSFEILKRDLIALVKSPIALLVVVALLVLPGLYAWYCIIANWDPYSNTGGMPIAVVNHDKGAKSDLTGEVNLGEQVVGKLQDNDSIDWHFYDDEEEALDDTRLGAVYATLVLPDDLSKNLVGIFDGTGEQPVIRYYPNEKFNAVATKVTDSAAQALLRQINQGFSSTVNEKVLESAQDVSDKVEKKAEETNRSAIAEVKSIQADLLQVIASLDDAMSAIEGWRSAATSANSALATTADQLPAISTMLARGSSELNDFRTETGDFESELSSSILKSASTVSELSSQASTTIVQATVDLKEVKTRLEALIKISGETSLKPVIKRLEDLIRRCENITDEVGDRATEINATVQDMTGSVKSATNQISHDVMPKLDSGAYELATSLSRLSGAVVQFEPQVVALQGVLTQADAALEDAKNAIVDAKALLTTIHGNLKGTVSDIGAIGKALQIERLSDLLDIDPKNLGTFVSSPVQLVTEEICPVSNYGTAVAPFYTNLALWIGCFILVSLIKVEVSGFPNATARQRYFGRWLLFVILSLLQSQVICGVDILLGIDCAHPALFMLAGAVCSFAYMNLIFAFVKTFRNVGKTLCIFLLIMQVPGSSGMYPIEMMPGFFQGIHPVLPFTYGIGAMREALSGLYGADYIRDLSIVALIVPVSLALGLLLRPVMANLLALFDEEMNKTGFFASEEYVQGEESNRFRSMVRALAAHESYADDIEERSWKFNRLYPRLRKMGSIATFVIPFAFLILMLPFNLEFALSTDTKLTALIIMLVLLLLVLFALIVLEYMHRFIAEETRLLGESIIGEDGGIDLFAELGGDSADDGSGEAGEGGSEVAGKVESDGDDIAAQSEPAPNGGPTRAIFTADLKLGFQSVVGVVVIMLLVVTPSMYAWFNIAGSWDPYSATGNLKVAVANDDEGYKGELVPMTINIGDTVVAQLRGNDNFDWVFVDKDEAVSGVESSKYYAAIEIPSDFSRNMMTYLVDDAEYPQVLYYTNEKENPIAPIITQKGADSIQENIRVSFTERVDAVVLSVAYDVLNYVTNPNMTSYVAKMSGHLDDAIADAKSAARQLRMLGGLSNTTAGVLDATGAAVDGMKVAADSAKEAVGDATAGIKGASAAIDKAVDIVRSMLYGRELDVDKVQAAIDTALGLLEDGAGYVPGELDEIIVEVKKLRDAAPTAELKAKFDALIKALQDAKTHADAIPGNVERARLKTDGLIQGAVSDIDAVKAYFNGDVAPSIEVLRGTLGDVVASTSQVVTGLKGVVEGLGDSTGGLSNQLNTLAGGLKKAGDKLEASAADIEATKKRVADALKSGDLKQIEDVILGSDSEAMAASLAEPLKLEREPVYSVANFGSAMAPFYTVLSLWVGALLLISTMSLQVVEERIEELKQRFGRVRPRHEFFGRYGLFGLIGLLQSLLVLLGDLLFLHIQCNNPVLFVLFGVFIGQMFCLIVYSIVKLSGDVGKALCVILLIMQVAASGCTFPAEMLDPLLLSVVPFLPFHHAVMLLQECVAGVYVPNALVCMAALAFMAGVMLLIGLPLSRPFRIVNDFLERQLEKTGFM